MVKVTDENYSFQKVIAVLGVTLMAVKFLAYHLTGSVAILTDATESIVNVVAAFVGLFALYLSAQPADRSHPFGHGKVEIVSATIEGVLIVVAGALIVIESVRSFFEPGEITDLDVGLVLVALSALANYAVGRMAIARGRRSRSPALEASGRHLCSDTYSSVGILIGLAVVYVAMHMGYDARWLDSSIAVVFGAIIMVTGLRVMRQCVDDAMDRADFGLVSDVTDAINEYRHDDWIDVYDLRLLKYGPRMHIDVHVVLPRNMQVSDLGMEVSELEEALERRFGDAVELSMVAVPCRDYNCRYCSRNCFERCADFERRVVWTAEMLCCDKPHAVDCLVTMRRE